MRSTELSPAAGGRPSLSAAGRADAAAGFSMLEMLVSITIIILLMSAVFPFLFQAQKRFQGNVVVSESNQSARAALEVMSQEIGQAGFNPNFTPAKTSSAVISASAAAQCVTLNNITGIHSGDWITVDTSPDNELVQIVATSNSLGPPCASARPNAARWSSSSRRCRPVPAGPSKARAAPAARSRYPSTSPARPHLRRPRILVMRTTSSSRSQQRSRG